MSTLKEREAEEALEELRSALPAGTMVTAVLRHRNRMGSSWIDFYVFSAHGWNPADGTVCVWDEWCGGVRANGAEVQS